MVNKGQKFKYFYGILREVYTIVEINWQMDDIKDFSKLIDIIRMHLNTYNHKNAAVKMGIMEEDDEQIIEIFLSDYSTGRGYKKLFSDTIPVKKIFRDKKIDHLLNDGDMDNFLTE